jgi:hypothetical protein
VSIQYYRQLLSENQSLWDHRPNAEEISMSDLGTECEPDYIILGRVATMYLEGGNNIEKNPMESYELFNEAAEKAMQAGKGRLANTYFSKAEEASALIDK